MARYSKGTGIGTKGTHYRYSGIHISRILISLLVLGNLTSCIDRNKPNIIESNKRDIRKCYGDSVCNACTSCNYCKWCNAGGICGICASPGRNKLKEPRRSISTMMQCKAITKKGHRCTRSVRSGNYCWQHGG